MSISPTTKGYFFAFISVLATSNVYIFSKAAMSEASLPQFGLYWFAFGLLWNLIYSVKTGKIDHLRRLKSKSFLILLILGLLEIAGTTFFFLAIFTVSNPAIVSFIGNINPVFVTLLGVFILHERYNKPEVFGILLILIGAFTVSYKGGDTFSSLFLDGTQYVLYSGLFFSASAIINKKHVIKLTPPIMALSRNVFLLVFSFSVMLIKQESFIISWYAMWNIIIGSVLGPFLTVIVGYQAIKYIEVSRKGILGSTKGIFVLIGAYVYFGKFPEAYQVIGGLISIVGVLFISFGKMMQRKKV